MREEGKYEWFSLKFWKSLAKAQTLFKKDQTSCLAMEKRLEDLLLQHVLSLYKQFKKWGETQSSTFAYWVMLLDAVQIMLLNIRSERQGNWTLHMHTVASMLPYFFATNRTNFSCWITVYPLEMSQIALDIQTAFENGEFSFTEIPEASIVYGVTWRQKRQSSRIQKEIVG